MTPLAAYAALRRLDLKVVETSDVAAALSMSTSATTRMLQHVAATGLIMPVCRGMWWLDGPIRPYELAPYLTAPLESYLSLHTALRMHGLIEQIPEVCYAVTLARTQRIETTAGTFSFHNLVPELFGGYEQRDDGVKLATPEKALFDFAYLSPGRSRLFTSLPELELPRTFRRSRIEPWISKIASARSRTITSRKLDELLRQR
jgi:predicted transcriptional regulator of viral defense system